MILSGRLVHAFLISEFARCEQARNAQNQETYENPEEPVFFANGANARCVSD
jgi:hypothetical protein